MNRILRQLAAVAALFFLTSFAQASEEFQTETLLRGVNAQGEKVFLLRFYEGGLWRLREIVQHRDGWQDLISQKSFSTLALAESAQRRLQQKYPTSQLMSFGQGLEPSIQLSGGVIWPTTQAWDWAWEQKYAAWLSTEMNADFFKLHNIATDCADVAYASRWIFARIHGLPAANRLSGTNALFTNSSLRAEWASLPTAKNWSEDRRFRAALNYLLNQGYTHALMRDSYPVAITTQNFLPGIHHLNLHEASGHTQLVHQVSLQGDEIPFMIIQSTTPRAVRVLSESLFWGSEAPVKGQSGFLRILWPKVRGGVYSLERPENMPGYSVEQYQAGFIREEKRPFSMEVYLRLKPDLDFVQLFNTGLANLKDALQARVATVEDGFAHCKGHGCPEGSSGYEEWSTPSRDGKILQMIRQLDLLRMMPMDPKDRLAISAIYMQELGKTYLILVQKEYSLKALRFVWMNGMPSFDPNDEPEQRWSLEPQAFAQRLSAKLKDLFTQRQQKVTLVVDEDIKRSYANSIAYCDHFSISDCNSLRMELSKTVKLLGTERTLQKWLERGFWFNSDPAQTSANQWGALRDRSKFLVLPSHLKEFQVTVAGIALMTDTSGITHLGPLGSEGLQEILPPADFAWKHLDSKSSVGYAFKGGQLLRHDFLSGEEVILQTPFQQIDSVIGLGADELVVLGKDHLWRVSVAAQQAQIRWERSFSELGTQSADSLLIKNAAGLGQILDLRSGQETQVDVALLNGRILFEDQKYLGMGAPPSTAGFIIEKGTGKAHAVENLAMMFAWSPIRNKAVQMSYEEEFHFFVAKLITFSADFQVLQTESLGEMAGYHDKAFLVKSRNSQGRELYTLEGNVLKPWSLLTGEISYTRLIGEWIGTELPGKNHRIRSFDGKRILYEGPKNHFLAGGQDEISYFWQFSEDFFQGQSLVPVSAMKAPALMTGHFFGFESIESFETLKTNISRGLLARYGDINFWVEFPQ